MREVIQCLIDWLDKDPSDEKPHRILHALAKESLKKAGFEEGKRCFTANELVAAAEEIPKPVDSKRWIDWPESFSNFWHTKEPQIIEFARQQGLQFYPKPERISIKAGLATWLLFASKRRHCQKYRKKIKFFKSIPRKNSDNYKPIMRLPHMAR
jgi:hypothetical protein